MLYGESSEVRMLGSDGKIYKVPLDVASKVEITAESNKKKWIYDTLDADENLNITEAQAMSLATDIYDKLVTEGAI